MSHSDALSRLAVPAGQRLGPLSRPKRTAAIAEAKSWPAGSNRTNQYYTPVSPLMDGYQVALGKPGKESEPDWGGRPNPNDMTPTVFLNGTRLDYTPSFTGIFREFQHMGVSFSEDGRASELALEILACMLFRSAFMLDHSETDPGSNTWRYHPDQDVLSLLQHELPCIEELSIPTSVFLHLIDALAWNEDVKYNPHGANLGGTGRQNTLLTCVKVIGVVVDRVSIADVIGHMTVARGVSPITQKSALLAFPYLAGRVG